MVLLLDADATSWPSSKKATALTLLVWSLSVLRQDPVAAFYSRMVLFTNADATSWLSSKKVTAKTAI